MASRNKPKGTQPNAPGTPPPSKSRRVAVVGEGLSPQGTPLQRELIVIAQPESMLRANSGRLESHVLGESVEISSLSSLLADAGAMLQPLFGVSEDRLRHTAQLLSPVVEGTMLDLSVYYQVQAPDEQLDQLAERLREHTLIEAAYVKPPGEPPQMLNDMAPSFEQAPTVTPDFSTRQGYLDPAPGGVDARYAWTLNGGAGAGVRIIDLEWSWRLGHEDLMQNFAGLVGGTMAGAANHGTAVIGEIGGDSNGFGIIGIAPDAVMSTVAFSMPSSTAIRMAADRLGSGDIMLLEIHRAGPRNNFQARADQQGYIAIEWWPDDFDAIRYAVSRGIIVVEAGGNGGENLDDPLYNTPGAGFPAGWTNPFNRANRDAGAIVVGAGAPPPGTHGHDHGPDRSRLDFSNYGALMDAQGWGREVTSCGYGDLQGPADQEDLWYTDQFSGTSSASPILVGTLACVQGVLRANGRIPLSPARARELLRATGSAQQDAVGRPATQRIGNRPDLRQLIGSAFETNTWTGALFTGVVPAGQALRWFSASWPAHWHVIWTIVPTTPQSQAGSPQIRYSIQTERQSDGLITYWITVSNLSSASINFEARYAVLGW